MKKKTSFYLAVAGAIICLLGAVVSLYVGNSCDGSLWLLATMWASNSVVLELDRLNRP